MNKESYHHGDLRNDLIKVGLKLLNEEGYDKLSLRKVAKLCNVSHTAPYRHFKNKDELVTAITVETIKKFNVALQQALIIYPDDYKKQLMEMGFLYIKFFVENPDYLQLLFLSDITQCVNSPAAAVAQADSPFATFFSCVKNLVAQKRGNPVELHSIALANWSLVHGLAIIITKKQYPYEGDYLELAKNIIQQGLLKIY